MVMDPQPSTDLLPIQERSLDNGMKSGSDIFSKILADMNRDGNFAISVLTDQEGFPIASATDNGHDPEKQAAVVALVQKVANQAHNQLGMGQSTEILLYDSLGQRLVCRMFTSNHHPMTLAVLIPHKTQPYRRVTNLAIQSICKNWE